MAITRRSLFKWWMAALALAGRPDWLRAQPAPEEPAGFPAGDLERALAEALGGRSWTPTDQIALEVPQLAENGAIVPITVASRLPDTRQILIFGEKNPGPLLARFRFEPGTDGWVSLRLKLNASGHVLAIAESGGRFYGVRQPVKVMLGGCG